MKIRKGDFVIHEYFGPLYVTGSFRDSSGTVFIGINGKDGVSYNFNACEVKQKISQEDFNAEMSLVK